MRTPIVGPSRRREVSEGRRRARRGFAGRPPEALEARSLLSNVFTVINTGDSTAAGSLRWAIGQVNADETDTGASPDQIHFAIPSSDPGFGLTTPGVWTIQPATALPLIDAPCIIDGYTQTGAVANTSAAADNAAIKVELDGGGPGTPQFGVQFGLQFGEGSGTDSTIPGTMSGVLGLAIHSFEADVGIIGLGVFVQGCFIGVNASGAAPAGRLSQSDAGVVAEGFFDMVGGADPAARDLVSNCNTGVVIDTDDVLVAGDLIGTDPTGTAAVPNNTGVAFNGASASTVGGTTAAARNVISGNDEDGIDIDGNSNLIEGNFIGTDVTGTKALGNGLDGLFTDIGTGNTVGGTTLAAANVISANGARAEGESSAGVELSGSDEDSSSADLVEGNLIGTDATGTKALGNVGNGIRVDAGTGHSLLGNVIDFNGALGIDLVGGTEDSFGVTANSPGGPHDGPNDLQNYPVLTSAVASTGRTVIAGTLNSNPSSTFEIDLYAVPTADPSGHGQALTYLGTTTVTTDASGNTTSPFSLTVPLDLTGQQITATATHLIAAEGEDAVSGRATPLIGVQGSMMPGSTSEFAADIPVTGAAAPSADVGVIGRSATPGPVLAGGLLTYTFTLEDLGPDAASGAVATVQVPLHTTFVSLAQSSPVFQFQSPAVGGGAGQTIRLSAASMAADQPVTLTLVVRVVPVAPAFTVLASTAGFASLTADPNPSNNVVATAAVAIPPPPPPPPPPAATVTGLAATPSVSTFGQTVIFTAVVVPTPLADGPTGSVVFYVDGKAAWKSPLVAAADGLSGTALFATPALTAGTHQVVAIYFGDASFAPSGSATLAETVVAPLPPPPPIIPIVPVAPPQVVEVLRFGYHEQPTALAVIFSAPVDPGRALNVNNYRIVGPGGQVIPVVAAALVPGDEAVVLQPKGLLNVHWTYTLTIVGTPPAGLTGASGAYIGSNPVETITISNLVLSPPTPVATPAVVAARPAQGAVDALMAAGWSAPVKASTALARRL